MNREQLRAERLRKLEGAANAYHHAKHTERGVKAARENLLRAAEEYGDTPNVRLDRPNAELR